MEEPTSALSPQAFAASGSRHLHNNTFPGFHSHNSPSIGSHLDPHLQSLDDDAFSAHFGTQLEQASNGHLLGVDNAFTQTNDQPRFQEIRSHMDPPPPRRSKSNFQQAGQFGILMPRSQASLRGPQQQEEQDDSLPQMPEQTGGEKQEGHFANMKMVPNPPDLEEWRQKLFEVNETITMTEDQFQTYFPHVDNVYSHRSTQRYKRKPFVSHYWDCRLKGRPPGTPKSEDPNKRKRKRNARERDLCDVKIKITEYFPGARTFIEHEFGDVTMVDTTEANNDLFASGEPFEPTFNRQQPQFRVTVPPLDRNGLPGSHGERYYTIQRVNGNGANGKGDGVAGPHKHTLEESDRVKKNSIQRHFLKEEKEKKKSQKTYHKKATGTALATVKKHSKDNELKLFGSCFCPFVQRVWIALEAKGMSYQYLEVDPYKKPDSLLEVNPRGLVPALRHGDWGSHESTVLMEYLEDLKDGEALLPEDPKGRAHSRLWADHVSPSDTFDHAHSQLNQQVNRNVVPAFYRYLQAQETTKQAEYAVELKDEITKLVDAAHSVGPFFLGAKMTFVDVQLAPWLLRLRRVLKPYRGWPDPDEGSRWAKWVEAVEENPHVKATTSTDELYLDSYLRYAGTASLKS
ncbi:MAG: hypothetical protein MMC33_007201 [Icmadophila ericetorum]|nr:hypothetical protein [Icmadophila ericetorum]